MKRFASLISSHKPGLGSVTRRGPQRSLVTAGRLVAAWFYPGSPCRVQPLALSGKTGGWSLLACSTSLLRCIAILLALQLGERDAASQVGSRDLTFANNLLPDGAINVVVPSRGLVYVGGEFSTFDSEKRAKVARLTANGVLDRTFDGGDGWNGNVLTLVVDTLGRVIAGGTFTTAGNTNRSYIVRLNSDGTVDTTFNPLNGFNNQVEALALQPDGKILVGGRFTAYGGVERRYVARLHPDGALDASFNPSPGPEDQVYSLALQADGKILIGGRFQRVAGLYRRCIARLESDGSLDFSFDPALGAGPQSAWFGQPPQINSIAVQASDGKVVIGGNFYWYNGLSRQGIARLLTNGTADATFNPNPGASLIVNSVAVSLSGKVVIGGTFESVNGVARGRFARFLSDGSLDPSFQSADGIVGPRDGREVRSVAIQPDESILVAGVFTNFNQTSAQNITKIQGVSSAPGGEFNFGEPKYVVTEGSPYVLVQVRRSGPPNLPVSVRVATTNLTGSWVANAGDYFSTNGVLSFGVGETSKSVVIRIKDDVLPENTEAFGIVLSNPTGGAELGPQRSAVVCIISNDASKALEGVDYGIGAGSLVRAMAEYPDGRLVVGGEFSEVARLNRRRLVRFAADGTVDESFNPSAFINDPNGDGGAIYALAIQADGKILVGGTFQIVNGFPRSFVARLNEDGSFDPEFLVDMSGLQSNSGVYCLAYMEEDDSILMGGYFLGVDGKLRNGLMRVYSDGNRHESFNVGGAGASSTVTQIRPLPDGKILISGSFDSYNGVYRRKIARLTPSGLLDPTFDPAGGGDNTIWDFSLQPDGNIVVVGEFTQFNDLRRRYVARLFTNGVADVSFNPGVLRNGESRGGDRPIRAVAVQPNGKILVGGEFNTFNDDTNAHYFARLLPNGDVDSSFQIGTNANGSISPGCLLLRSDGHLLLGGALTDFDGLTRRFLAEIRINSEAPGGEIEFGQPVYEIAETGGAVTVEVFRRGNAEQTVTVEYCTTNGTASFPDYGAVNDVLVFGPGEVRKTFVVPIVNDGVVENDETIGLLLKNPTDGAALACQITSLISIVDDDSFPWIDHYGKVIPQSAGSEVRGIAVQPNDKKVVLVGEFGEIGGVNRNGIVRLMPDGKVDLSFRANAFIDGVPTKVAVQPDGRVLVGGNFGVVSSVSRPHLARFLPDGRFDASFDAVLDNQVRDFVVQRDGKILVAGYFTAARGKGRQRIARLYADGSLDDAFVPWAGANGVIHTLAVQPDGKILIGGDFSEVYSDSAFTRVYRPYLARLNADGSLDSTFDPGAGPNRSVYDIALQDDGKIVVVGNFNYFGATYNWNSSFLSQGVFRSGIARLHPDGSIDTSFKGNLGDSVNYPPSAVEVTQPGNLIVVAGPVQSVPRGITRFNADGSQDAAFEVGSGAHSIDPSRRDVAIVKTVAVQPDGWILAGGYFSAFDELARNHLVRLRGVPVAPNGIFSFARSNFEVSETEPTAVITVMRTGNLSREASVRVTTSNGSATGEDYVPVDRVLRFTSGMSSNTVSVPVLNDAAMENAETVKLSLSLPTDDAGLGSLRESVLVIRSEDEPNVLENTSFDLAGDAGSIAVMPDGKTVVAGAFDSVGDYSRRRLVRLNPDGSIDTSFYSQAGADYGSIYGMLPQPDGKILLCGDFNRMNGVGRNRMARLNSDGSIDATFSPSFDGGGDGYTAVYTMLLQNNGLILVGGRFTTVNNQVRNGLVRLFPDGTLDPSFGIGTGVNDPRLYVNRLGLLPGGGIAVAGNFGRFNTSAHRYFTKLLNDGSADPSYSPGSSFNNSIQSIVVASDGKLLIGGYFSEFNSQLFNRILRLDTNGLPDPTFVAGTGFTNSPSDNAVVDAIAQDSDGKILVSGLFNGYNGTSNVLNLARLAEDGSLDTSFDVRSDSRISLMTMSPTGQVLLGGSLTRINGTPRVGIARLKGNLTSPPACLRFISIRVDESGVVHLVLEGAPQTFNLYRADHLTDDPAGWRRIQTVIMRESPIEVLDPTAAGLPWAFYKPCGAGVP